MLAESPAAFVHIVNPINASVYRLRENHNVSTRHAKRSKRASARSCSTGAGGPRANVIFVFLALPQAQALYVRAA